MRTQPPVELVSQRMAPPAPLPPPPVLTSAGRTRRRSRWPLWLGVAAFGLVGVLVALLLIVNLVVKPRVGDAAATGISRGVRSEVRAQLATQVGQKPTGKVVITEADVNQRIASSGNLDPIDDVSVDVTPSGLDVELHAYGLGGTYHATLVSQNGTVALQGGSLDGPLSYVVPSGELTTAVNEQIASALADAGYQVDGVTSDDNQIILTVQQ
jgi:hypothetical protein